MVYGINLHYLDWSETPGKYTVENSGYQWCTVYTYIIWTSRKPLKSIQLKTQDTSGVLYGRHLHYLDWSETPGKYTVKTQGTSGVRYTPTLFKLVGNPWQVHS